MTFVAAMRPRSLSVNCEGPYSFDRNLRAMFAPTCPNSSELHLEHQRGIRHPPQCPRVGPPKMQTLCNYQASKVSQFHEAFGEPRHSRIRCHGGFVCVPSLHRLLNSLQIFSNGPTDQITGVQPFFLCQSYQPG